MKLTNKVTEVYIQSLSASEVRIHSTAMKDNLGHTLFNHLVVLRPVRTNKQACQIIKIYNLFQWCYATYIILNAIKSLIPSVALRKTAMTLSFQGDKRHFHILYSALQSLWAIMKIIKTWDINLISVIRCTVLEKTWLVNERK